MNILYVSTISGTINLFLVPHITRLMDQGHTVSIACRVDDPIHPELSARGVKVYPIAFQRSPFDKRNLQAYRELNRVLDEEDRFDWVHTHTPVASALVRLACRDRQDVKVLYTAHGFHFFKGAARENWLTYYPVEKALSHYTDVLITMNSEDYACAADEFSAGCIVNVHGVGVDLSRFMLQTESEKEHLRREYGFRPDDFILVYAAALNNRKHQTVLIEAMAELTKVVPKAKLLLIGKGPNEVGYRALINLLKLENHVHLMGYRKDVPQLMQLADVAVSSSNQEGLPVNVMEAMAIGLPLVVSACRGNRDLVEDGRNGFLIREDDPAMYAEKLATLYFDEKLRESMKQESAAMIQDYAVENVLREMDGIYADLLRRG
ncbi:glycosyltransferase family 4 protein [uncultured Trichococcus sp.]|uniref:glycosyltransferase family 4 protein n=1 Tax=uncultured Trichococcus sp. TaxID=189665 RepID=UPI0029C91B61|nr:glycosyltransferase family 4 protein [uncultured Trichococcus sp.]